MKQSLGALQYVTKCPHSAQLKHVTLGILSDSSAGLSSGRGMTSSFGFTSSCLSSVVPPFAYSPKNFVALACSQNSFAAFD
jgi:hypothetical protein